MISKQEILAHLDELVIEHTVFSELCDKLLMTIQEGARGRILMVVGPTGVGKTELAGLLIDILTKFVESHPELGFWPPIFLDADSPEYGEFTWRAFYMQGLKKLAEPAIRSKRNIDALIEELQLGRPKSSYQSLHVYELRDLYLEALEELRPIAVFIDEAASFEKTRSHANKGGNLNVIKSISNRKSTIQVLLGAIDAKKMLFHEAQTSRRVEPVPMWHYSRIQADVDYYVELLQKALQVLEVPCDRALFTDKRYIYTHALGLVGAGMEWERRAIEEMFRTKCKVLQREHLAATRLSNRQLAAMAIDMNAFEVEFGDRTDFDIDAYFAKPPKAALPQSRGVGKKSKPGQRKPKRDSTKRPRDLETE